MKIRKGDEVVVTKGKDKGKSRWVWGHAGAPVLYSQPQHAPIHYTPDPIDWTHWPLLRRCREGTAHNEGGKECHGLHVLHAALCHERCHLPHESQRGPKCTTYRCIPFFGEAQDKNAKRESYLLK